MEKNMKWTEADLRYVEHLSFSEDNYCFALLLSCLAYL